MVDGDKNKEKIQDIMLAVDVGYDIENVAAGYVEQFNKISHFTILEWEVRNPTDKEIDHANQHQLHVDKVFKKGDEWFTSYKPPNSGKVLKRVFVLVVKRYQKIPQHLYEAKMKAMNVESINKKFVDSVDLKGNKGE